MKNIKKEVLLFLIGLGIICLNFPILIILSLLVPDNIGDWMLPIIAIELIGIGLATAYIEFAGGRQERKSCEVCYGTIIDSKYNRRNFKWMKTPIVSYTVNGKKYTTAVPFGINGILGSMIIGKEIKVFYKADEPDSPIFTGYIWYIVGVMFFAAGLYVLTLAI